MIAFVMAGGKGTRLSSVTKDEIPKPMVSLCGKPILQHAIENLKKYGVNEIYISVGHLHEKIEEYFKDGQNFGVKIHYIIEEFPLGSAGALFYVKDKIKEDFVVCSGDTLFDVDLKSMLSFHKKNKSDVTLICRPNNHPYDSDLMVVDENKKVTGIISKNLERDFDYQNLANAGFFILSPNSLQFFTEPKKFGMEHDFIVSLIKIGKVFAYDSTEYIKDIGTPERLKEAEADLKNNLLQLKSKKSRKKAIFLDRDGVINRYKGFITKPDQIELCKGAAKAIKKINDSEFLAVVITNQPVVARGECTLEELKNIFNRMETLLGKQGAFLNAIYFCPHHPDKGFFGEVPEFKIECNCRKPNIGMIEKACEDFNLDIRKCYLIGDENRDLKAAQNAGIPGIFVKSEANSVPEQKPNFAAENLLEAVNYVLNKKGE